MLLNKEERQVIERLYGLTAVDRKNITELFVNLSSLLVLSTVSTQKLGVALPFIGRLQILPEVEGEEPRWGFTPSALLTKSVMQARDGDDGDIDKILSDSISHLFRDRV